MFLIAFLDPLIFTLSYCPISGVHHTFYIHPGLDYGNGDDDWKYRIVVSLCDGVVIQGRDQTSKATGSRDNGGSAGPGRGISVRCYMDSLSYLDDNDPSNDYLIDTDHDGHPNLSNLVIVYNHLLWRPNAIENKILLHGPYNMDCVYAYIDPIEDCNGDLTKFELPRFRYPGNADQVGIIESRIGDVVHVGSVLGQTGSLNADGSGIDHLHLEMWLARDYLKPHQADAGDSVVHTVNINPYLMYVPQVLAQHWLQPFFPTSYRYSVLNNGGLTQSDLDVWSVGGVDYFTYGANNNFYTNQDPSIPGVEWPTGVHPVLFAHPLSTSDLVFLLKSEYKSNPYNPVNCPIAIQIDPDHLPHEKEIATCQMNDLHYTLSQS